MYIYDKKDRKYKLVSTSIFNGLKQKKKAYEYEMEMISKSSKDQIHHFYFTVCIYSVTT